MLYIAENIDGVPIGMIWCEIRNLHNAFIAEMFVYEQYRGMGYGSAIMAELERNLKQRKVLSVTLHVFEYF
jgi:GNAT superfamily N-acetyltransferase